MDLVVGFSIFAVCSGRGFLWWWWLMQVCGAVVVVVGQRAVGMVVADVGLFDYFLMGL